MCCCASHALMGLLGHTCAWLRLMEQLNPGNASWRLRSGNVVNQKPTRVARAACQGRHDRLLATHIDALLCLTHRACIDSCCPHAGYRPGKPFATKQCRSALTQSTLLKDGVQQQCCAWQGKTVVGPELAKLCKVTSQIREIS